MNKNKTIFDYLKPHNLVRLDDWNIIQIEQVWGIPKGKHKFKICSISTHYCPLEFEIDKIEEIFELDTKGNYTLVWRKNNEE